MIFTNNFSRIAGYEKEKEELLKLRNLLANAEKYKEVGVRIPRGLILVGEPGVGKTAMAKAIAGPGINVVDCKIESESNVSELLTKAFRVAKKNQPSVLIIDEFDKITEEMPWSLHEKDTSDEVIILQRELDALESSNVLVVATCNNVEYIRRSLLRPGRFDRIINIPLPDFEARKKIIAHYFNKLKMDVSVNFDKMSKLTAGYSGASIECLVNECGILAMEKETPTVENDDVRIAMNRIAFQGLEGEPCQEDEHLYRIAVHEAGHAFAEWSLHPETVDSVSVLPQGESLGHLKTVNDDRHNPSFTEIKEMIGVALAGRAAEIAVLGEEIAGASSDISYASRIATQLFTSEGYEGFRFAVSRSAHNLSEEGKSLLEERTAELMEDIKNSMIKKLTENADKIKTLATELVSRKVLDSDEINRIFGNEEINLISA